MQKQLAAALLTLCSLNACTTTKIAISKPPADRLVCDALTARPSLPPEYVIDWTKAAQDEHGKYVASVRAREGIVAGYIVAVEGNWFSCSDDVRFNKAFFDAQ